jgi:ABC-type sugar transport system permease subunit
VDPPAETQNGPAPSVLTPEERRWLHDKYERLAAEEGQLSASRTSYYAAIGTVLLTAFVVAIADLLSHALILVGVVSFLALLGIVISVIWAVLLHRTTDAEKLYREAAGRLEAAEPPLTGALAAPITLRSGATMTVNLLRPYETHDRRFARTAPISWMDRTSPSALTEALPRVFIAIWTVVAIATWTWFLFFQ